MSEPSEIRWLNVGVVAAAAALCAVPRDDAATDTLVSVDRRFPIARYVDRSGPVPDDPGVYPSAGVSAARIC